MLFRDRLHAGEELSNSIEKYLIQSIKNFEDLDIESLRELLVVFGIPRGGIVLGDVIASRLRCNLDMVISRKIGAPNNRELAIGAVMPGGTYFVNEFFVKLLNISKGYIEDEVHHQTQQIERRLREFRKNDAYEKEIEGKTVILVDDGIATGSTIIAASKWIANSKYQCKNLVVAAPVAPGTDDVLAKLNQYADELIILFTPVDFNAVGQFYQDFEQVTDSEVKKIMEKYDS